MTNKPTIALCMGTRPEIIKMAPVVHQIRAAGLEPHVIHTGQHDSMAHPLYEFFNIPPNSTLPLTRQRPDLAHLNAQLLDGMGQQLQAIRPDALLVHGDTSSALAGALAGFFMQIPVGHVEAGLRTGERYDPFPEEKNRELIGRLAHWHFAPTQRAAQNLLREGIANSDIHMVGNTVIDAIQFASQHLHDSPQQGAQYLPSQLTDLQMLDPRKHKLLLITAHRRENWGEPLANIARAVCDLLLEHSDMLAVWPVHANPAVQHTVMSTIEALLGTQPDVRQRIYLCEPLTYPPFVWLLQRTWLVLTDSGGIQEEATALHCPVFVLRETTERPELLEAGAGQLVGTHPESIRTAVHQLVTHEAQRLAMCQAINPFGDGHSAKRIAQTLAQHFNLPHN